MKFYCIHVDDGRKGRRVATSLSLQGSISVLNLLPVLTGFPPAVPDQAWQSIGGGGENFRRCIIISEGTYAAQSAQKGEMKKFPV
jgi:hypothetical protein